MTRTRRRVSVIGHLRRTVVALFCVAPVFAVAALSCNRDPANESTAVLPAQEEPDMVALLARIADTADPQVNVFLNDRRADLLRRDMDAGVQPGQDVPTRLLYAIELLRAGRAAEAREHLLRVRRQLEARSTNPDADPQIYWVTDWIATASLRQGELENCIALHNADACLMPVRGGGVHTVRRGSRAAFAAYDWMLQRNPADLSARWLMNLAAMTLGEYPEGMPEAWRIPEAAFAADADIGRFVDVAPQAGVAALGLAGGSIMEDFDGDGLLDLMASSWGLRDQLRLFHNNGDGTFSDRTAAAGLEGITSGLNLIHADYNNDGFADVLVLRGAWLAEAGRHPNSLLRNNGDGTFTDVTRAAGLLSFHPTQTAAWADFDNDGWVDLFIGNETGDQTARFAGQDSPAGPAGTPGPHACELYRNNGDGTFTECAAEVGVAHVGFVKGVTWGDYDNDGLADLYLSCQGETNVLYRNLGRQGDRWRFADVTQAAGVVAPTQSFPTWFWDYDNDGWLDLFVAAYDGVSVGQVAASYMGQPRDVEAPRLYRNNGDGTFADVTDATGAGAGFLTMGANFGDLDNDGYPDFYLGTGAPDTRMLLPNLMYRNAGGHRFEDVTTSGGFGHLQKGHGIAFGDIDGDGDQDLYAVMGGAYSGDVFPNALFVNPGHGNRWVTLRLQGTRVNRAAIGARIQLDVDTPSGPRTIYSTVGTGGSFGASSLQQEIGLGQASRIRELTITWPGTGAQERFTDVALDRCYRIREGAGTLDPVQLRTFALSTPSALSEPAQAHRHHPAAHGL